MTDCIHKLNHCLNLDDNHNHRCQTKQCLSSLVVAAATQKMISDSDWLLIGPEQRTQMLIVWLTQTEKVL